MFDVLIQTCREESAGSVAELLTFFLDECEIDQAPSQQEVLLIQSILLERGGKFNRLAALCQQWLDEQV